MENKIEVNDFVWAKMTGYPPWPSIVLEPLADVPEKPTKGDAGTDFQWVYFFGSQNFAWIEDSHLKRYDEYKEKFTSLYKASSFKEAVSEIEDVLLELKENPNHLPTLVEEIRQKQKAETPKRKRSPGNSSRRPRSSTSTRSYENGVNSAKSKKIKKNVSTKQILSSKRSRTLADNVYTSDSESTSSTNFQSPFDSQHSILRTKHINASALTFGVLGTGLVGSELIKNLIRSGHKVNIWNRTITKCSELEKNLQSYGTLNSKLTPRYVLEHSDIVFMCVSDHVIAKRIIQDYFGVNDSSDHLLKGKGLVILTCIDPENSKDISDMIEKKGGKFLEAQIQRSKVSEGEDDGLILLAAGNELLFYDCQSSFKALGKTSVYLGEVGYASKMNLVLQLIKGVCLAGLAEGFALAERCWASGGDFINIFNMTTLASTYLKQKADCISSKKFNNVELSLHNMQKDMMLGLELSNQIGQPMDLASIANEVFKHCRKLDYGNQDAASVFMRSRH